MRSLAFLLVGVALIAPSMTHAGPAVTLNGVNISGVVNQRFENVNVIIDAKGNLEIQAKGYAARLRQGQRIAGPADVAHAPNHTVALRLILRRPSGVVA